jgi:hypothetical protein
VAVGDASGHAGPPTAATVAAPPSTRVQHPSPLIPRDGPPAPRSRRRRPRRLLLVAAGMLLAAAAAAAALVGPAAGGGGARDAPAPLSEDDVRGVAEDFANAYGAEDGAALGRLLTGGVERVLPAGVARGRARVVAQYQRQFRAQATKGYELEGLVVRGGQAGRASGRYRVERAGGDAIEGRIVLGVVRDRGTPRIALIAVTPRA